MWCWQLWESFFGAKKPVKEQHDDSLELGVSCVRAVEGKRPRSVHMIINKQEWVQRQYAHGRYVIEDSQFKIGEQLRSVPKLRSIAESTLLKENPHVLGGLIQ